MEIYESASVSSTHTSSRGHDESLRKDIISKLEKLEIYASQPFDIEKLLRYALSLDINIDDYREKICEFCVTKILQLLIKKVALQVQENLWLPSENITDKDIIMKNRKKIATLTSIKEQILSYKTLIDTYSNNTSYSIPDENEIKKIILPIFGK